jgi:Archaeal flagella assembly protein J
MAGIFDQFFSGIEKDLLVINSKENPSKYIYKAKIYSIGISISVSILTFFSFLIYNIKLYGSLNITLPLILGIVVGILGFFGSILLFKKYPSIEKQNRARKIDNSLYYAVLYMASLVSSSATPKALFELLSKYSEFSEIKKEASEIIYLIDTVGLSLPLALERRQNILHQRNGLQY